MLTELISVIWGRKKRAVNSVPKLRQVLFTSLVVGTTVTMTGCTSGGFSISSMNPFSKQEATVEKTPGITEAIAESAEVTKSQLASFGGSAKKVFTKTTSAVTDAFSFGKAKQAEEEVNSDPLSLANKPASVGPEVYVANGRLWESTGDNSKAMESMARHCRASQAIQRLSRALPDCIYAKGTRSRRLSISSRHCSRQKPQMMPNCTMSWVWP